MFDGIVFPAPKAPSYSVDTSYRNGRLVHIPRLPSAAGYEDADHTGFAAAACGAPSDCPPQFSPFGARECGEDWSWGAGLLMWPTPKQRVPVIDTKRRLLIYGHPNAVDIGMMAYELSVYATEFDCVVLAYEFRGYGLCDGKPSEEACLVDLKSAIMFARSTLDFEVCDMVLMGRSIGTGPAVQIAAGFGRASSSQDTDDAAATGAGTSTPALVLLESPFTSIRSTTGAIASNLGLGALSSFASSMVGDRFRSIDAIDSITSLVVIVHGTEDSIVPYEHGQQLAAKANAAVSDGEQQRCALVTLRGVGHNDLPPAATVKAVALAAPHIFAKDVVRRPLRHISSEWCIGQCSFGKLTHDGKCNLPYSTTEHPGNVAACMLYSAASFASATRLAWIEYNYVLSKFSNDAASKAVNAISQSIGLPASSGGASELRPFALPEFVDVCLSAWGSPFAVYRVGDQTSWFGLSITSDGAICRFDRLWGSISDVISSGGLVGQGVSKRLPVYYLEPSSRFREIIAKNVERTSTVALHHPAERDPVTTELNRDGPRQKVAALTERGARALQLECEHLAFHVLHHDGVDAVLQHVQSSPPATEWCRVYETNSARMAELGLCVTRRQSADGIIALHSALDQQRRHVAHLFSGDDAQLSFARARPDPRAAVKHPRDATPEQAETETEAQRGLRLLRQRRSRTSDGDCLVA